MFKLQTILFVASDDSKEQAVSLCMLCKGQQSGGEFTEVYWLLSCGLL